MYRRELPGQTKLIFPFNVELNPESKWVKIADLIPWDRIEEDYVKHFTSNEGQIAKPARLAFGALYIQVSEGFTDEQVRTHIQENPHMQYFCGFPSYSAAPPFDASMMVHFRKRFPAEIIKQIAEEVFGPAALNEIDVLEPKKKALEEVESEEDAIEKTVAAKNVTDNNNRGTLILDATCCPQDIRYPTDIGLMNQAREVSEEIVDKLYDTVAGQYDYKPRTYRQVARKDYLTFAKKRKHTKKSIRKHLRKQLQYVARDLRIIQDLIDKGALLTVLSKTLYKKLPVIEEVFRQQKEMYDTKTNRCDERIVSISQPHIRPIVRGKEHNSTEFGSKVAIGLVAGYAFITNISWENTAEASLLPQAAEQYNSMFGFYPKAIIGDGVYPNRSNRAYCADHNIRLSGPKLGRKNEEIKQEEARQQYKDGCERNAVEGKFGTTKLKYGLDCIMTKLPETSLTMVAMGFFVANMERKLRLLFVPDSPVFVFCYFQLTKRIIAEEYLLAA